MLRGSGFFAELYSDHSSHLGWRIREYEIRFTIPLPFFKLEAHFLVAAALENGALADQVDGIPIPEIVDPEADPHMESIRWGLARLPEWTPVREIATGCLNDGLENSLGV
jgi:hypothetical protein